jgi:hypothetical protein
VKSDVKNGLLDRVSLATSPCEVPDAKVVPSKQVAKDDWADIEDELH